MLQQGISAPNCPRSQGSSGTKLLIAHAIYDVIPDSPIASWLDRLDGNNVCNISVSDADVSIHYLTSIMKSAVLPIAITTNNTFNWFLNEAWSVEAIHTALFMLNENNRKNADSIHMTLKQVNLYI